MTVLVLAATILLRPSDACYESYSAEWCDAHADALAEARPVFDHLTTDDAVGGYEEGDLVETGFGSTVTVPDEALDAVASAGRKLGEEPTSWSEARLMLDLAACESGFELRAENPNSTASGPWQFLASTWRSVAGATGFADRSSWLDHAANALHLGRHSTWRAWECLGIVR